MQSIMVQDPVIDPFAGCAVVINLPVFRCPPGDWGIKPDIPVWLCIDRPAIRGSGADTVAVVYFFRCKWAPPF